MAKRRKLTKAQIAQIRTAAIEESVNDAESDRGFLIQLVTRYIDGLSLDAQLGVISSEEETQAELLGFDPYTGKSMEYED